MSDFPDNTPEWVRSAKVGDKVVSLVDGKTCSQLKRGMVLTIRRMEPAKFICRLKIGLWFEEITREPYRFFPKDTPYACNAFRPVSKRSTETGMTTLRRIADSAKLPENA